MSRCTEAFQVEIGKDCCALVQGKSKEGDVFCMVLVKCRVLVEAASRGKTLFDWNPSANKPIDLHLYCA